MKIENIKINQYGKLENKNIDLKKINIIYGKNESGKSTLLNFIESIFYGISKNKNGKKYTDFEKYTPWNQNEFSGAIQYKLDNEKEYYVFRDFNKKNPKIYDENNNDISDEFFIDKRNGNQFFLEQTKIDRDLLKSTLISEQNSIELNNNTQELLLQKISNLAETGSEENSYKSAMAKLDRMLLNEVGTEKSSLRPINISEEKIKKLTQEITEIKNYENYKFELENKKNKIENELSEEKENKKIYDKIKRIINDDKIENEKIKIKNNIIEENNKKIEKLKQEKLNKEKNKKQKSNIIILAIIILINILNFIFNKNTKMVFTKIITISLIPLYIIYILYKNRKYNSESIVQQIKILEKNNSEISDEAEKLKTELINKNKIEKEKMVNEYGKNINELFTSEINEISEDNLNSINNLELELHKIQLDKNNINPILEKLSDDEELLEIEQRNYEELEEKRNIYNLTKELMSQSYKEMKEKITPKFNKNLSENIEKFSNNKYNNIIIKEGLKVKLDNGELIDTEKLSLGTIEQIYLALRMSVIDELSEETMPIMLDEPFAFFDDERLEETLEYLKKIKNQIIILTCTDREKKILEENKIEYNYIEL